MRRTLARSEGLTNGTSYDFTVTATNGVGTSLPSDPSNDITPATVPDPPTDVTAAAGDESASVTWVPGFDEGSPIASYTVTATGDGGDETCTYDVPENGETDTCTVGGLTNGTSYDFTVTATNGVGTSLPSDPSNDITPATVPDPPTDVTAAAGDESASVTWVPGFDEGSPIASYTVTATGDGGDETCTYDVPENGETDTCTVGGLTNGTSYDFTVTATNGVGTSLPSDPSNDITPATVPDPPTDVTAAAGDESASVTWVPGFDEGSPIASYTVTATGDGGDETCTYDVPENGETDTCTVGGLTNGTSYDFTVTATNGVGTSLPSDPSNDITPATVPDPPTDVTAAAGDESASVTWVPGFDEGSPIASYTVTATGDGGDETCTYDVPENGETDTCTVGGLTNGTSYDFTVTATNGVGTSLPSDPSNSVVPLGD